MATLWAKTATFEGMSPGDDLPILVKHVTQADIVQFGRLASGRKGEGWRDLHTDEEYASQGMFAGTVLHGPATVAYVAELLEKALPLDRLMAEGSQLEMRATRPVYAGDTVTFTGQLTGKDGAEGGRWISYEVDGTNQKGEVVAKAEGKIVY